MRQVMLGLLTNNDHPQLTPDDNLLAQALHQRGVPFQIINWNEALPPAEITHLLIRSPWDYYLQPQKFLSYLDTCEDSGIRVLNDATIVRWNHTKQYLEELAQKGLNVVDSLFVKSDQSAQQVKELLLKSDWPEVVIKPTISGSSYLTFKTRADSPEFLVQARKILAHGDLMAQPFLPSIQDSGEVSMLYFYSDRPEYSHSVLKVPKSGDFRVQNDFGGKSIHYSPSPALRELAEKIILSLPAGWLYLRIDLVDCKNKPLISEIELIEPALYFQQFPKSAIRLAEILSTLAR